jgi:hypothetical protein
MQPLWIGTLPDDLRSRLARRRTGYVLRTGAAWAGTIGRTTIRLHYGKEVPKGSIRFLDRAGQPLDEAATRAWSYDPENSEEVLVLRNLEPDANSDIRYEITPLTPREEATVLREALAEKRLRPWAMKHLLELVVEEDALGTAPSERGALVLGILREMVPPRGPTFAQEGPGGETPEGALSAGEEQVLVAAYRRLLSLPAGTLEADEIPAIRHAYRAFLGAIVGRKKAWYDANPAKQTGRSWEEYRKLEAEWEGLGEGEGR